MYLIVPVIAKSRQNNFHKKTSFFRSHEIQRFSKSAQSLPTRYSSAALYKTKGSVYDIILKVKPFLKYF
jgi:hypothetical protein